MKLPRIIMFLKFKSVWSDSGHTTPQSGDPVCNFYIVALIIKQELEDITIDIAIW